MYVCRRNPGKHVNASAALAKTLGRDAEACRLGTWHVDLASSRSIPCGNLLLLALKVLLRT
jgi:hypothetical protein